ncbi:SsgA family sporulation/cell division regulator [Streptomyces sp. GC420]|uniref:SsgA family sporulation/cell division regulator n=1 Tax=Streptomyces sp. GC420 TaxID=2697568 RepID=UPI00141506E1|nr:SsgA family sporulation/cell division regulator [Streptomyces sp. GC420]NBM15528.1 SsgA family sporulation/cell division regulator [Streptomyces sp. GC420]
MRASVSVQAEVTMSFLVSEELSFRIPVDLRYETNDPYAVRLTFHLPGDAPVGWAFGRDLLSGGLIGPCGDGDVHIAPADPEEALGEVLLKLQVGGERALFRAGTAPLLAFLDRTAKLVPPGQERACGTFEKHLDEALCRILAEEQNAG